MSSHRGAVSFAFDGPDADTVRSTTTIVATDRATGSERRWVCTGAPWGRLLRWLDTHVEPLLRRTQVSWNDVAGYRTEHGAIGEVYLRGQWRDTFSARLDLRVVPAVDALKLEVVAHDSDRPIEDRPRVQTIPPTYVDRQSLFRALLDAAGTYTGRDAREPRTARTVADVRATITALSDGADVVPYHRSLGEVRGALLTTTSSSYSRDERLRRYVRESDVLPRILTEIRTEPCAEERYRRLFTTTWDDVRRLAFDRLALRPDPNAVLGVSLVVWSRTESLTPLALRVLGRIATPDATEVVVDHLTDPDTATAIAAVHAAGRIDSSETRHALARIGRTNRPGVARVARRVLDTSV